MRLIKVFLFLLLITGCSSPDTKSTEKVNNDIKEKSYSREITQEEQKYIQLVLNKDYNTLLSLTEKKSNEVQEDYYNIAFAFIKQNEIEQLLSKKDDIALDKKLSLKYGAIVRSIESVKFIPPELKTSVNTLYKTAVKKEKYYSQKDDEQVRKVTEEFNREEKIEHTTKNPKTVSIGMTQEEVLTEGWGRPIDINRTITANGTIEQWVYDGDKYLYFENGILTAIQD
ncbi:hypothetical protein ABET52_13770 [Saccharococcus caldoxylosilyticus]|uniref:hypothetical protein n=1 Tax=Saccharococcus caldoxylosilyticus TaxID=81408 RepID=UPI003D34A95C